MKTQPPPIKAPPPTTSHTGAALANDMTTVVNERRRKETTTAIATVTTTIIDGAVAKTTERRIGVQNPIVTKRGENRAAVQTEEQEEEVWRIGTIIAIVRRDAKPVAASIAIVATSIRRRNVSYATPETTAGGAAPRGIEGKGATTGGDPIAANRPVVAVETETWTIETITTVTEGRTGIEIATVGIEAEEGGETQTKARVEIALVTDATGVSPATVKYGTKTTVVVDRKGRIR